MEREGEISEEEIARLSSELVRFFRNLPASAKEAYARLAALDRELGERTPPEKDGAA